jgi:hypothetical protein
VRRPAAAAVLAVFALYAATALAADDKKTYLPEEVTKAKTTVRGWDGSLSLGASSNFTQNSNVIGATDGMAWSFGAQAAGTLGYVRGQHEWANALKLGETFTYTTALDEFVKTADELDWRTTYFYYLKPVPWLGPFGEFRFKTNIFPSYDVQSSDVTYLVDGVDYGTKNRFRLSVPFAPIYLQEAVGAFGRPVQKTQITVEIKLGFGAKHVFADGDYAVDDDKDTKNIIEIKALRDLHQGGPAAGVGAKGSVVGGKVQYSALFEAMVPLINNISEGDDRNAGELTNLLIEAGLSFKLVSWASLDYQFKALREPQLLDKWQVQNNLLLTFSYNLVKSRASETADKTAK